MNKNTISILPALVLMFSPQTSQAGSATWKSNPVDSDWNNPSNWTPATVPNGPNDVATFGVSNTTGVTISAPIQLNGIVFSPGSSAYSISAPGGFSLSLSGSGVVNNSGVSQTLTAMGDGAGGTITFTGVASAADATLIGNGATASGGGAGAVEFAGSSTAGSATLIANSGQVTGAAGGVIRFLDNATGGTSRVITLGDGELDTSASAIHDVTVGSIEGNGVITIGGGDFNTLEVGSNSRNCEFKGLIRDSAAPNVYGGTLLKLGSGTLTLGHANVYTGFTLIEEGTLLVNNKYGSGTGYSAVQVDAGTLGGTGYLLNGATVGSPTRPATLAPGRGDRPGRLTLGGVAFNRHTTFRINIDTTTSTASELLSLNVTIAGGHITLVDRGGLTLSVGTVLTVIDNYGTNPISGNFLNLRDGATITAGSNTFQANYEGGDGNDLTLTVVP